MTIPVVLPLADKGMVTMLRVQGLIVRKCFDNLRKVFCEKLLVLATGFPP